MKHLSFLLVIVVIASGCKKAASASSTPQSTAPAAQTTASASAAPAAPAPVVGPKPMPAQIPTVLARVNGEAIEKWEFDNAVKSVEQRAGGPVPAERRDEILRGVLDQLVTLHLLAQE